MKSAKIIKLTILVMVLALYICGSAIAAKPIDKTKKAPKAKPAIKMPVFKGVKFTEDDKNFSLWLNETYPTEAESLKEVEKNAKEYQARLKLKKVKWRRMYGAYKKNPRHGKALIVQRELRLKRTAIVNKLKAAKENKSKVKLRDELNKIVSSEFDIAVQVKKIMYEGLRAAIKRMEKRLAQREREVIKLIEHKDDEVKNRVEELIKGEEKIRWK